MPYIKVNIQKLREYQDTVQGIRSRVSDISDRLSSVGRRLDWDIRDSKNIDSKIQNATSELNSYETALRRMETFFGNTSRTYLNLDGSTSVGDDPSDSSKADPIVNRPGDREDDGDGITLPWRPGKDDDVVTILPWTPRKIPGYLVGSDEDYVYDCAPCIDIISDLGRPSIDAWGPPVGIAGVSGIASAIQTAFENVKNGTSSAPTDDGTGATGAGATVTATTESQKKDFEIGAKAGHSFSDTEKKIEDKLEEKDYRKEKKVFDEDKGEGYFKKTEKDGKTTWEKVDGKEAPVYMDRSATVYEVSYGGELLYDNFHQIGDRKDTDGDGTNGYVAFGESELHASIAGGFYVYSADGKKVFSPGVHAELGGSFSAIHAEGEAQLVGNDMLGVDVGGELNAGRVEGELSGDIQFADENGKFNPQFSAKASAEAIAVEAEADIGLDILGGGVKGTAGINVGVGAHADIGYKDGVLKCDIGASLGVGVSLDVEIDIGGMVETAVEGAQALWEDIQPEVTEFIDNAKETAVSVWEDVKDFGEAAINTVVDVAEAAWDGIQDAGEAVADAVVDIAETVTDTVVETVETVVETAKNVVDTTVETVTNVVNTVADAAVSAVETVKDVGTTVVNAVAEGATSAWNSVKSGVKKFFSGW